MTGGQQAEQFALSPRSSRHDCLEGGQESPVFLFCADRDPQAVLQQGVCAMQFFYEDAPVKQRPVDFGGRPGMRAKQYEVGLAGPDLDPFQFAESGK